MTSVELVAAVLLEPVRCGKVKTFLHRTRSLTQSTLQLWQTLTDTRGQGLTPNNYRDTLVQGMTDTRGQGLTPNNYRDTMGQGMTDTRSKGLTPDTERQTGTDTRH